MDISTSPVSGAPAQLPLPSSFTTAPTDSAPATTTIPAATSASVKAAPAVKASTNALSNADLHQQIIQQASQSAAFNYPLGDKEFTIFKDNSGQYITRYVSLRDGSITYIPEPTLVRHTLSVVGNASNPALVALNA